MMRTRREKEIAAARAVIGDGRLVAFLRRCGDGGGLLACRLVNEGLDEGKSLDELFYTGNRFGYELSVRQTGPREFDVAFGCLAGPEAGDGGRWTVSFTPEGEAETVEPGEQWVS